jgi:hypothetical protein
MIEARIQNYTADDSMTYLVFHIIKDGAKKQWNYITKEIIDRFLEDNPQLQHKSLRDKIETLVAFQALQHRTDETFVTVRFDDSIKAIGLYTAFPFTKKIALPTVITA